MTFVSINKKKFCSAKTKIILRDRQVYTVQCMYIHTYHNHRVLTQTKNHKMEKKSSNITIQIYINLPGDIKKMYVD